MAGDGDSKEDKFDFSSEGEALGYISLEQARLLAMQTDREAPGDYGRRFRGIRMVFQPVQEEDGEDYYVVTLSFRPEGDFAGNPGKEQFFIEKEGRAPTGRCSVTQEQKGDGVYRLFPSVSGW